MLTDDEERELIKYVEQLEDLIRYYKSVTDFSGLNEFSIYEAIDLRRMADNIDERAGYATADAHHLRKIARHFDKFPVETSHSEILDKLSGRKIHRFRE